MKLCAIFSNHTVVFNQFSYKKALWWRFVFLFTDLDGNGVWDADEVKALFLKELDKMYTPGAAEDDMRERIEELERMREHVFREADTNKDGLIR